MELLKPNRNRKTKVYKTDEKGRKRLALVIMYDDLSKAKKPPAWMKELLFGGDAEKAG